MGAPSSGPEVSGKAARGVTPSPGDSCCGGEWEADQGRLGSAELGPRVKQQQ